MSASSGRPALAISLPDPPDAPCPGPLQALLARLDEDGLVSAAAALVGGPRGVSVAGAVGDALPRRGKGQPLFDLASLSKLWTASLALRLDARRLLALATELGDLWPGCDARLARRTLEDLLRHRAGLQPWTPLYRRCRRRSTVATLLLDGRLLGARRGTYSDLDYVLWGLSVERALGRPLGDLLRREVVEPLDLRGSPTRDTFRLPCRLGNEREVELAAAQGIRIGQLGGPAAGRVQDGNARFLSAPAGHAGVFATPHAILALSREWLWPRRLWTPAAAAAALTGPGPFVVGWRRATRRGSAGSALGPDARGHVGFTGGSVWLDPGRGRIMILLTQRTATAVDLAPARRRFHALAVAGEGTM